MPWMVQFAIILIAVAIATLVFLGVMYYLNQPSHLTHLPSDDGQEQ